MIRPSHQNPVSDLHFNWGIILNYRKHICEGLLLIFFLIMMRKWLLLKNIPILRLEYKNYTLFMTRINQIRYPIYDQNCWKTIPFGAAHTYIAHIREYPPPPGNILPQRSSCAFILKPQRSSCGFQDSSSSDPQSAARRTSDAKRSSCACIIFWLLTAVRHFKVCYFH